MIRAQTGVPGRRRTPQKPALIVRTSGLGSGATFSEADCTILRSDVPIVDSPGSITVTRRHLSLQFRQKMANLGG
jgi:hypothetical protein